MHHDVFRVSNDPSELRTGIVMSCVYVIGSKMTKSKRLIFSRGPDNKHMSLIISAW